MAIPCACSYARSLKVIPLFRCGWAANYSVVLEKLLRTDRWACLGKKITHTRKQFFWVAGSKSVYFNYNFKVVDSADIRRLEDCKKELDSLLTQEKLAGASLLIFANKQVFQNDGVIFACF